MPARRIIAALPVIPQIAWANRGFLMRAATFALYSGELASMIFAAACSGVIPKCSV